MIHFKEPEGLFHTAALGQRGASGNELDYQDTEVPQTMGFAFTVQIRQKMKEKAKNFYSTQLYIVG